ncbi:MAG TPA: cupin domain-containing protein [Solirubrobacteraceae bacterium]|nr:cupin domain-containing protein [Solirubrobacteraceae bacterium]
MKFVRQLDWDSAEIVLPHGYKGQFLYSAEDCHVVATLVPPGASGPPQHKHVVDQIYVIVRGTITIQLGAEVRTAGANDTIFIPAGVPHHNWNDGDTDEMHIEVIAPGVLPTHPLGLPADGDTDDRGLPYFVRGASADGPTPEAPGITNQWLVTGEDKSDHATIYLTSLETGTSGTATHINAFHEFYYVIEGTLSTEIALDRYDAPAGSLVSIPAGVPHRFWNSGREPERHVTIVVPSPIAGSKDDLGGVAVTLSATGELPGARDPSLAAV